jgi:class 3 adenylate cyclase
MQVELNSDVALSAANALVSHLRKNPEAAMTPARDLASTFGLEESFVAQVLQGIQAKRRPEMRQPSTGKGAARTVGGALRSSWMRLTSRPVLFVILTFVLCYAAVFALVVLTPRPQSSTVRVNSGHSGWSGPNLVVALLVLAIVGGTFLLHMVVYFRHRSGKNALWGGLFLFCSLSVLMGFAVLVGGKVKIPEGSPSPVVLFLAMSMVMLMVALMYTGMGALASVLGAWTRIKLQDRAEESMSRQDLLERYFELQSRLQKSAYPRPSGGGPAFLNSQWIRVYRRYQFILNLGVGFGLAGFGLLAMKASGITPGQQNPQINAWFFVLMFVGIFEYLIYIFQGYLSKSAWAAALGAACVLAGKTLTLLLPFRELTLADMGIGNYLIAEAMELLLLIGVSCAGYLGLVVQNRAAKELSLQRNDQATLLAEMVRIQWKLSNETAAVCVLVVDAAKSSEMKASADPLAVEYVFREYQEWIEKICGARQGRVHSTAGDGAVVAFNTCGLALSAAKRIQTDLFQFNKDVNRLQQPFRLRIGLHTGEVVGDINEVQFTEVIDIAAHIESACPIGGIAVTDDVVARLPDEQFVNLDVSVDGHSVYLVSNPTEYQ